MDSAIANYFILLNNRIVAQVPEIRYIDQDLGQLDFYQERPAVSWPCVLLDVGDFTFSNYGNLSQSGEGQIVIRLGFTPFSSANSKAPDLVKFKALKFYDIEHKLVNALHGWTPDTGDYGNLIRVSATTEKREDPFRVREIRFKLAFEDFSTQRAKLTAAATPVILINPKEGTGDFNTDFNDDFSGE